MRSVMQSHREELFTAEALRSSRIAAGVTRQQLASSVGVSTDVVRQWEDGDTAIDCQRAVRQVLRHAVSDDRSRR